MAGERVEAFLRDPGRGQRFLGDGGPFMGLLARREEARPVGPYFGR